MCLEYLTFKSRLDGVLTGTSEMYLWISEGVFYDNKGCVLGYQKVCFRVSYGVF